MTEVLLGVIVVIALLAMTAAAASVRILREYERGVVFRLGRLLPQKGPGVVLLIPFIDRLVRVSLRTVTLQVPAQDVITRDNVPARVTAVTYFRVVDPNKSIVEIQDVLAAAAAATGLVLGGRRLMRDRRLRPRTGAEALVGHVGVLRRAPDPEARVFVDGALWRAEPDWQHQDAELHAGDRVVVERVHGLTLCVRKAEDWELVR